MNKLQRIGVKQVPVYIIPVTIADNDNDWTFVPHKFGLHMHNGFVCSRCTVLAVF